MATAVAIADNGDVIVAGVTNSFGAGGKDVWVLRLDANGNIKWQKTYGGGGYDEAHAVAIAPNGDIIIAGHTNSFSAGGLDLLVLRLPFENPPECDFCRDSSAVVKDSEGRVRFTDAVVMVSEATVENTKAEVRDTNAEVKTLETTGGTLMENLKIQVPKTVYTPLPWGAFPIVIENPTDSEIEVPIIVKSESFEKVKISQDLENPFQSMPTEREDRLTVKLNPNEKKILTVVFGSRELEKNMADYLILQIGDNFSSIYTGISPKFLMSYEDQEINEHPQDLIESKGYINFEGKKAKVLPIENFVAVTNYDPRIHGWGFSNKDAGKKYNWGSKTFIKNYMYALNTYALPQYVSNEFGEGTLPVITMLIFPIVLVTPQNGVCYGMTYTSGLYYQAILNIPESLGNIDDPSDTITLDGKKVPAEDLITLYFSSQYLNYFPKLCTIFHKNL